MNKLLSFLFSGSSGRLPLDPTSAGLSAGLTAGILLIVYSAVAFGTGYGIEIESFIESLLPGYTLSLGGTVVGVIWVFSLGYIIGFFRAWLYNKLLKKA